MKKENKTYMAIPCGISDQPDRLTSHVETELNSEICTPANSKSKVRIIRQLSKTKVEVACLWCGKHFETYKCKIKKGRGKYCSKKCLGKSNGLQKVLEGKVFNSQDVSGNKNPNWKSGKFVNCEICGELYWKYPSRKTATCSVTCGYKRALLVKKGKLTPIEHSKTYGNKKHWEKLRLSILKRDKFMCQNCLSCYNDYTTFLHVHHIIRLVDGGTNTENNLITLCKYCHAKVHIKDRKSF